MDLLLVLLLVEWVLLLLLLLLALPLIFSLTLLRLAVDCRNYFGCSVAVTPCCAQEF